MDNRVAHQERADHRCHPLWSARDARVGDPLIGGSSIPSVRVLRVYHGGRDASHRFRERALESAGVDVTLVVPSSWPTGAATGDPTLESFRVIELPVRRPGDRNRHAYADISTLRHLVEEVAPDVLDIHQEPFSVVARQWLSVSPPRLPVVMYTAQNVDKRFPPPFANYERQAHCRVAALYPCSRQAAAVARGKGFSGPIEVLPLGFDPSLFFPGTQSVEDDEVTLALFGRLVPEKGVLDAIQILAKLCATRSARLIVVGSGPEEDAARALAARLGVAERLEIDTWQSGDAVAEVFRRAHIVLVPSKITTTWTEQFGRVIVEAQASGAVVAGYATGSIPEVASDAAVLASVGDVDGLSNGIAELLSSPDEFAARRSRGIELSADRTWSEVAGRQASLYEQVVADAALETALPSSPRRRRAIARAEFGATAPTTAGFRPFALPVLRRGGPVPAALGTVIDAGAEIKSALRSRVGG